ncbi:MAG: NifU family protein [Acidobacteriota bacterium]|nr:NifU family protein [Acidobacteriota bacterium]MDH3783776.1 NifU family protein [Acidobacteriota bacterium]
MIRLTDAAREKFLEIASSEGKTDHGLRVIVHGGGSPRPEFALNFVAPADVADSDQSFEQDGVRLYADKTDVHFLEDAEIDFVDGLKESGFRVIAPNAGLKRPEGPLAEAVQRVLDEKINPGVASHGGMVALVAVEDGVAYLKFGGGCQGCGQVQATLQEGVERVLFEDVPEITKVMDVTDHAAGTNPYYQP